jgi:hypothetical protein
MKMTLLEPAKTDVDGAAMVAEALDQAIRCYADFSSRLRPPASEKEEAVGNNAVRRMGARRSAILAEVNRVVDNDPESIDLNGQPFLPPQGVVNALHDLEDSFTLMREIESYADLMAKPLVPWERIRAELDTPESREWMTLALAAYPFHQA